MNRSLLTTLLCWVLYVFVVLGWQAYKQAPWIVSLCRGGA